MKGKRDYLNSRHLRGGEYSSSSLNSLKENGRWGRNDRPNYGMCRMIRSNISWLMRERGGKMTTSLQEKWIFFAEDGWPISLTRYRCSSSRPPGWFLEARPHPVQFPRCFIEVPHRKRRQDNSSQGRWRE